MKNFGLKVCVLLHTVGLIKSRKYVCPTIDIINQALRFFPSIEEAVSDLSFIYLLPSS